MAKRKRDDGIPLTEREAAELTDGVDQRLIVAKQRHHHWEGTIALFEGLGQTFKRSESANVIRIDIPRSER